MKLGIEFRPVSLYCRDVKVAAAKNEARLLDQATNNLLRAVKQEMLKREGRVDYGKLRKDGYNERVLAKLKKA